MSLIRIDDASFGYRFSTVLREVSLDVDADCVVMVGDNGSGKSTVLATLATALQPKGGVVELAGKHVSEKADRNWIRRNVGWLPQNLSAPRGMTVTELATYAGWLKGDGTPSSDDIMRALEMTNVADRAGERVDQLSGGFARRAFLAATLVARPKVLLLDEPTAGLDETSTIGLVDTLGQLVSDGMAVVVVSHHPRDFMELDPLIVRVVSGQGLAVQAA